MFPQVRQATVLDLEQLIPLFDAYRQFYGKAPDVAVARQFLTDRLARQESVVLLAEDGGGVVLGFVQMFPSFSSVGAAPIYILNDLFVVPTSRGKGIGTLLMRAAADAARAVGAVRLKLSTAITNVPAQRLYNVLGWERDEEFYGYNLSL